jgi:hypothetical protein
MGFEFDCPGRPAFVRIPGSDSGTGDDKLLGFVARCPGGRDNSVGVEFVDLTVIATMAAKYRDLTPALAGSRARNTKPSPLAATSRPKPKQISMPSTIGPSRR